MSQDPRPEKRTIKNWAARLSMQDELLTLEEAQAFAQIVQADRLLETRDMISDIQIRIMRLEQFIAGTLPGYDEFVRQRLERDTEYKQAQGLPAPESPQEQPPPPPPSLPSRGVRPHVTAPALRGRSPVLLGTDRRSGRTDRPGQAVPGD
jgi:hypothetical protein